MKQNKGKKNMVENKEELAENWCFVCKDGGDLRICDHKDCLKSYHPNCVGKEDSFLDNEDYWACDRHICFICHRYSVLHCYTCTNSLCRRCLPGAGFLKVKGQYGFCSLCLRLALLIEENKNYDSDGERVDFTDRETYEGLFMEYYLIVKEAEGFESGDLYTTRNQVKVKKKRRSGYVSEEFDEIEEEVTDDDDDSEDEKKRKRSRRDNRSERQEAAMQTPAKSTKTDFVGWASRSLFEFLTSIGKSASEKLSQHDVASIVNEYVKEHRLFNPEKKRIINCDAQLQSLFKRRTISRYRINDLLEGHFAENQDESEGDEPVYDSEDKNTVISNPSKKQRKLDTENKTQKNEVKPALRETCLAALVVENIKLVYLKRSLLRQLIKEPESFEEKVVGCFVRVKSDPQDCRSIHSYQLMQVKGVKVVPNGETSTKSVLQLHDMPGETGIELVSDDDFTEEECADLKQKMLSGQLERPTIGYLEEKAKILQEAMTKHWIAKELSILQHLIDRANEKGWIREKFEYMEKRKRLQDPSELQKLLENPPTASPDVASALDIELVPTQISKGSKD